MTRSISFICIFAALSILAVKAQSPKPIIVQAASATTAPASAVAVPDNSASMQTAIKSLQEARAANSETLKKQEAVLEQLDEMQKNASQLKIFAHRTGG